MAEENFNYESIKRSLEAQKEAIKQFKKTYLLYLSIDRNHSKGFLSIHDNIAVRLKYMSINFERVENNYLDVDQNAEDGHVASLQRNNFLNSLSVFNKELGEFKKIVEERKEELQRIKSSKNGNLLILAVNLISVCDLNNDTISSGFGNRFGGDDVMRR